MSIKQLSSFVSPPRKPIYATDDGHWIAAQKSLQVELPVDYRELSLTYGSGKFVDHQWLEIQVLNPFAPDYLPWVNGICDIMRELKGNLGESYVPHGIHPQFPGLLPWAVDAGGNTMFWLTEGAPDRWPILLYAGDEIEFQMVRYSVVEFLLNIFRRHSHCFLWRDFFECDGAVVFESSRQLA